MRDIPAALQAHLEQDATTTCRLLKITLADGREFGMTTLDRLVTYEGVDYSSVDGFDPSVIASDAGLSVDNAEATALFSADISGITSEMVAAGELDDATWEMLLVNWADLAMGHVVLDAGDIGEVKTEDEIVYMPELLSYAMRLRQPVGRYWSRTCRAVFGTPADSQHGCGVDASGLWVDGSVDAADEDDPRRVFFINDSTPILDPVPTTMRVRWTTGPNSGSRLYQVEGYFTDTGAIVLIEPTPYPIDAGHEFEIRPDCDKTPANCAFYENFINLKGEPLIPVGDGVGIMTPGASVPGGMVG